MSSKTKLIITPAQNLTSPNRFYNQDITYIGKSNIICQIILVLFISINFVNFSQAKLNEFSFLRYSDCSAVEENVHLICSSWKQFPLQSQFNKNIISKNQTFGLIDDTGADINHTKIPTSTNKKQEKLRHIANSTFKNSFEVNQSFPITKNTRNKFNDVRFHTPKKSELNNTIGMDKIRVDGFNGLRFSARRNGCFTPPVSGSPYSGSLVTSASESIRVSQAGINPNKAVFTIESKTSQILIVNRNACELLGYTPNELCDMQLSNLLSNKKKNHVSALAEGQLNSEDGTMVLLSGKVVEMTTKHAAKVAVSLWIRQIDDNTCLAIAELVERRISQITIDRNGSIITGDYEALLLFQLESLEQFCGMDIHTIIPAIQLPSSDASIISKNIQKQKATGKTTDGISFPLCLMISHQDSGIDSSDSGVSNGCGSYVVTVWVFQNISGLLVIDENGLIESCNHHFANLMFGYTQNRILGMDIINLIPNFGQEMYYLGCTRSRNATTSSLDNDESETETEDIGNPSECVSSSAVPYVDISKALSEPVNIGARNSISNEFKDSNPNSLLLKSTSENIFLVEDCENNRNAANIENALMHSCDLPTPVNETCSLSESITTQQKRTSGSYDAFKTIDYSSSDLSRDNCDKELKDNGQLITSTPCNRRFSTLIHSKPITDGRYKGEAVHCDENVIDIVYTISKQILPCGRKVFCVWICRDPDIENDMDENGKHQNLTLTFNSVNSTIENSLGQAIRYTAAQNSSRPNSVSLLSQCEDDQVNGDYNNHYTTLKQIGEGAYGYVKMAYRHHDRLLVITKFILKEKLMPHCMVVTEDKRSIPMEIYLLKLVKHPNIVTVLDVFENEKYFQLVMEKHGSGMDLFEFIDRRPHMDEVLACYIFRQIANAVNYLHSIQILHRDIKDENVIIDQHFHVKLIDFGSATFMEEGRLFSTFYGTTEYCSPEVLAGNKYAGPELEMWSMGVTLYVLLFVENPFLDIEETLRAELKLPHMVSGTLQDLLFSMLDKNPKTRCTMKQLLSNAWIRQEINPATFKFSQVVQLVDSHEANPDRYYTGQVYSSNTGLSTASPHSLSLADEDSEEAEIEDEEETSLPSQDESCEKCANISTNFPRNECLSHGNKSKLFTSELELNSEIEPGNLQLTPTNLIDDLPQSNVCCDCCPSVSVQRACNEFAFNRKHIFYVYSDLSEKTSLQSNLDVSSNTLASMSLNSSIPISVDRKHSMPLSKSSLDFREMFNSEKLLEESGNDSSILASILNVDSGMISLSKSETNIFEGSNSIKLVYDVVSLNNLNDIDPFPNRPMIDLSKNQLLHNISNDEINSKSKL